MKKRLQNYNIPILIVAILTVISGFGYITYNQNEIFTVQEIVEEPLIDEQKNETITTVITEEQTVDHAVINGRWESEKLSSGAYLNFTIDYPKVINYNDEIGSIEERNVGSNNQYIVYLKDGDGKLKLFIKDLNGDSATIWYPNEEGKYLDYLVLTRTEKPAEAEQETVTETPAQDNTASQQSKPSGSSGNNSNSSGNGSGNSSGTGTSGKSGHYEDQLVCVQEAYDEQVLVKKGECTQVCVQEAYDTEEMVYLDGAFYGPDTEERAWCYTCQHFWDDHCELAGHAFNNKTVNLTEPYWHNVEYRTVHHDAVYETQCEPDVYETVHHDAVYETQKVWVED